MTRRRRRRRQCSSPAAPLRVLEDEDLLADILLRLPPQPSSLARAGSVCKIWRRLVSSPSFLRQYRARHQKPPLLGVFMDRHGHPTFHSVLDPPDAIPAHRFLLWHNVGDRWGLFGVRHGRVLVFNYTRQEFIVWDPATGDRRCVAAPGKLRDTGTAVCNGAVLCAGHGPGHVHGRDCHSSAFQVVMIGINRDEKQAIACVYSSETREWGHFRSTEIDYWDDINTSKALIGNSLYWFIDNMNIAYGAILEFDLVRSSLATIKVPPVIMDNPDNFSYQIVQAEDGGVCLAVTTRDTLAMWDRKVSCNGVGTWVLRKAVKLEEVTGLSGSKRGKVIIHGYDEDDNAIFLRTDIGCFMVQLESMQFRSLGKRDFITTCAYYPYRSFYLPKGFTLDYQMVWDDCIGSFEQQKLVLQEVLNSADCRVSLSIDTLTMNETTGYICVTCHFINTDWKVQKRIVKFFVVEKPYNGVEILKAVLKCIQEWNIEEKIFAITLRDDTANDLMVNMLKHNLLQKKVLPLEGNLFCNSCVTHTINLIVNNGLRFADPIVSKIRESVKYIQSSESRMQMFGEIIAEDDISYEHWPTLDTPTSWHSTYCLLKMALEYRSVFNSLGLKDANYTYALSFEEWERVGVLCRLLEACFEAIVAIVHSSTSNLFFHVMWSVKLALDREASAVDKDVKKVVKAMTKTFNRYWMKSYISLSIPVIFDPRFKYMFVEFRLKQAFSSSADNHLKGVHKVLTGLFDEYSRLNDCNADPTHRGCDQEIDMMAMADNYPFDDWYQHLRNNIQVSTELDRYLNESPIQQANFDVLKWWMVYSPIYPTLARIARDVLAMPMSIIASKTTLSTKERSISDHHSKLTTETTEALICLQDWSQASGSHSSMTSIIGVRDHVEFRIDSLS